MNFNNLNFEIIKGRRGKLFLTLLAVITSGIYLTGCDSSKGQQAPPPPMKVPVSKPLHQSIHEWDKYTGRFRAVEKVEVRSRLSGYIAQIKFKDGDMVRKGDVLFVIDQRPFRIALQQAEAQLEQSEAEQRQAQNAFSRVESLQGSRAISQEEYEQRKQALHVASARVKAAQAEVNRARLDLEFTVVNAPVSGRISENFITEGNLISGGSDQATLLTTIVSLDPIYFYFEGSESALLKYTRQNSKDSLRNSVNPNNKILVKLLDEEDFVHEGRLDFMDNTVDFGTGTFQGRALIPNPDLIIEPGMFGTAQVLNKEASKALLIPDAVIATDQAQKIVYVLSEENKVVAKPIETGPLHTRELRIIRSGLTPDDRIIVGNLQKIRPEMVVAPEVRTIAGNLGN